MYLYIITITYLIYGFDLKIWPYLVELFNLQLCGP